MNPEGMAKAKAGHPADGRSFRELASVVSSPYAAALESASNRTLILRAAVIALIVVLGLFALVRSQQRAPLALDVAGAGQCFVARDGGVAWHSVRQCRGLGNAARVEHMTIVEARRLGQGARWQRPCRLCVAALRRDPDNRDRWEEMELLLRERAVASSQGP